MYAQLKKSNENNTTGKASNEGSGFTVQAAEGADRELHYEVEIEKEDND